MMGYTTSGIVFGVKRLKVKVRVRVNSNTARVRTLWVPSSVKIRLSRSYIFK